MMLTKQNGQRSHNKNECDRARAARGSAVARTIRLLKPELSAVVNKINFTWRWFTSLGASVYESPSQDPPPASET